MKRGVFIETSNYLCLMRAISSAEDSDKGMPGMVAAWGNSGLGKTMAAQRIYAGREGVYVRAMEGMTQNAFLQEILYELNGERPHGVARNRQRILHVLESKTLTLYVDEADRLDTRRLEDLRDLHDISGVCVVLIGEEGLVSKIAARSRIDGRIPEAYRVAFDTLTKQDVMLFAHEAAGLKLSPEACAGLHRAVAGNFRQLHNAMLLLENSARANGIAEIPAELVRVALGNGRRAAA